MSLFGETEYLNSVVELDDITNEISKIFDYEFDGNSQFKVPDMPEVESSFGIGVIVGPSGTGKSTLLKKFGKEYTYDWNPNKAIVSHFSDAKTAAKMLGAVGLNSVPTWTKPYHVLSTGEKHRADMARCLRSGAVVDEFTSVVDRTVAISLACAMGRYVKNFNVKNVVLATCHYDILEWLEPDWVYDLATETLTRGCQRRPNIKFTLEESSTKVWKYFSNHHYLSGNINKGVRCWTAWWEDRPIGFSSVISMPSGTIKNAWRGHRTVICPDYQGLGFGPRMSEATGEIMLSEGKKYYCKTANIRLGEYRNQSKKWRNASHNMKARKDYLTEIDGSVKRRKDSKLSIEHLTKHADRLCYSHEYIGLR